MGVDPALLVAGFGLLITGLVVGAATVDTDLESCAVTRRSMDGAGPCRDTWDLGTWAADDVVCGGLALVLIGFALILVWIAAKDPLRG